MNFYIKKVANLQLIFLCLALVGKSAQVFQYNSQNLELEDETSTSNGPETTPEPWPMAFIMDTEESKDHPWLTSVVSYDPVTQYYFSYFKDWNKQSDSDYLKDYFKEHNKTTEFEALKKNVKTLGFWTTFSNQHCYPATTTTTKKDQLLEERSPIEDTNETFSETTSKTPSETTSTSETASNSTTDITTTESITTPKPYCNDYEDHDRYPHITLELSDPDRYILKSLEITYAKHQNSNLNLSYSCSINGSMVDSVEFPIEQTDDECMELEAVAGWNCFSHNFTVDDFNVEDCANFIPENVKTIEIKINLLIESDELNSGEFILVDQIVVTALDRNGEPPPTTEPPEINTEESPDTTKLEEGSSQDPSTTPTSNGSPVMLSIRIPFLLFTIIIITYGL